MNDFICRFADLPMKVNAVTVVDENGDFNIYINANLSKERQNKSFIHECRHIRKNHFYQEMAVEECEMEADLRDKAKYKIDESLV